MNNNNNSLVSVIIPTKDRGELLYRAIESVALQSYDYIEIVIVDDGSVDVVSSERVAKSAKARPFNIIRNDSSKGGAASRNQGVENCNGEYVCFLDDDDVYMPSKIEVLLRALNENQRFQIAFGKIKLNNGNNKRFPIKYPDKFDSKLNFYLGNYIHTNSTLIRKNVFKTVKFNENLPKYQDTQLHLELTLKFDILYVDVCVAEWNVDGRSDQITNIDSNAKLLKSQEAFQLLREYFERELGVNQSELSFFIYYGGLLSIRSKAPNWYLKAFEIVMHPFNTLKVATLRKRYFVK